MRQIKNDSDVNSPRKKTFFVILFLSSNDEVAKNVYSHFEVKYGTFAQDKFIKLMFLKNVKYNETSLLQ